MSFAGTTLNIIDACNSRRLFANWFKNRATWDAWFAFLKAFFALPMTAAEQAIFTECTGRSQPPTSPANECWLVCGRRAGKSFILSLIAVYLATFRDWSPYLTPGERAVVMIIATDRKQAKVIFRYVQALIAGVPALDALVERESDDAIVLTNGISIEITTASFRAVRGVSIIAALLDEAAFWRSDESANPDVEILNAIIPAQATVPGAVRLIASSPYARRGIVWDAYKKFYGQHVAPLVWQAPTRRMNPAVPQSFIDEQYERDPASAAAEYGALFRTDVESLLTREIVEAVTIPGRYELPRMPGTTYTAFVDPSGGSADSMTLAIVHRDKKGMGILDAVRERRPKFSPEAVVEEFAALLKSYGINRIFGDRYAGEWVRQPFKFKGIDYICAEQSASDFYRDVLPLFNSGKIELLDNSRLMQQFVSLERRTSRSGKDLISHPPGTGPGCHDDLANAVSAALVMVTAKAPMVIPPAVLARMGRPTLRTPIKVFF